MPSVFSRKKAASTVGLPWTATWAPGASLENFFALYGYHSLADANGDFTTTGATSIATTLDGPIQVARFRNLTVNHAVTPSQRNRGLMPIADTLSVGASGSISMTGFGAAGSSKWATSKDIFVPQSITFTGKNTSYAQFLAWIKSTGYCIFDPSLYACPPPGMGDVQCDWATWTPYGGTIISAAGCGSGAVGTYNAAGNTGGAGTNAPGGGASGGSQSGGGGSSLSGAPGRTWGGGPASGGGTNTGPTVAAIPDIYGGPGGAAYGGGIGGGGAGNPGGAKSSTGIDGGTGTGGILIVIVRGAVSLTAGHALSANGIAGGNATSGYGGGGSGGGFVGLYYSGTLTGTANLTATGGPAGTGTNAGGAGGAGSTAAATFATKGW